MNRGVMTSKWKIFLGTNFVFYVANKGPRNLKVLISSNSLKNTTNTYLRRSNQLPTKKRETKKKYSTALKL